MGLIMWTRILRIFFVGVLLAWAACPALAQEQTLLVFTAASTTDAITEVGQAFSRKTGVKVTNSFAASSTLAKQVMHGAPAEIYISANQKWLEYLVSQDMIVPSSRVNILRNKLVLIAPAGSKIKSIKIARGLDLRGILGQGRLALGDPAHVPAGIYAKEAFTKLGLWDSVKSQIASGATVRAALALVEHGEAPLGAVYITDAKISPKVKVVGEFPPDSHTPISYPAAIIAGKDSPRARAYMNFLLSPQAKAIFKKHGFLVE
jgi:molybdate transport system substrate-binding protein